MATAILKSFNIYQDAQALVNKLLNKATKSDLCYLEKYNERVYTIIEHIALIGLNHYQMPNESFPFPTFYDVIFLG